MASDHNGSGEGSSRRKVLECMTLSRKRCGSRSPPFVIFMIRVAMKRSLDNRHTVTAN